MLIVYSSFLKRSFIDVEVPFLFVYLFICLFIYLFKSLFTVGIQK